MIVPFDGAEASFSIYKGPVSGVHSRAHFLEEREFIEFGTRGHKTLKVCTCLVPNLLAVDALDRAGHQHKMANRVGGQLIAKASTAAAFITSLLGGEGAQG